MVEPRFARKEPRGFCLRSTHPTTMLQEILILLRRRPFEPFAVRTSDGHEYVVPTPDHAALNPKGTRLVIFTDDDQQFSLSSLHVAGIRSPLDLART